jgi:hypothetical protein
MSNLFPDTRDLGPSAARAAIVSHLLGRLEAAPLNTYGDPSYTYASALGELEAGVDGYTWSVLDTCWRAARDMYDTRHPKKVSTLQPLLSPIVYYREGLPTNVPQ